MDEYMQTIVKESAALFAVGIVGAALIALIIGLYRYGELRHAMTLSTGPLALT